MTESTSNPLVSILIPCWGCRDYIAAAIGSALAQTYSPLEIIVTEDAGRDGTYEEARKFHDPRLKVVRNEHNFGQYGNKNEALRLSTGRLIKYCDGDDLLLPGCVDRLVDAWRQAGGDVGVVFARCNIIDEKGQVFTEISHWGLAGRCDGRRVLEAVTLMRKPGSRFGNVTPHLLARSVVEAVGRFPESNPWAGDLEVFLKMLAVADCVFLEDILTSYRVGPGSITKSTGSIRACRENLGTVDRLEEFFRSCPTAPAHLQDPAFFRTWRVWGNGDHILANRQRKLRRRDNEFEAIRQLYVDLGLESEFAAYVRRNFLPFLARAVLTKARRALGVAQHPSLFAGRWRRLPQTREAL